MMLIAEWSDWVQWFSGGVISHADFTYIFVTFIASIIHRYGHLVAMCNCLITEDSCRPDFRIL